MTLWNMALESQFRGVWLVVGGPRHRTLLVNWRTVKA